MLKKTLLAAAASTVMFAGAAVAQTNDALVNQLGFANGAGVFQDANSLLAGWNNSEVNQGALTDNEAQVSQEDAALNTSDVNQAAGDDNSASVDQSGLANGSEIDQFALDDNSALVEQLGLLNISTVGQTGDNNAAATNQVGGVNSSIITQTGN